MDECLKIIDFILNNLNAQLEDLRDSVYNKRIYYPGAEWERQLRLYDECAIKKYQTEYIKQQILEKVNEGK